MILSAEMVDEILAHCREGLPNEACGLLAGRADQVQRVHLLANVDPSPTSYTIDPAGHFAALQEAEGKGWDLIGAFHSHTHAPAYPSPTDVVGAAEPDWTWLVVGPMDAEPEIRAFRIQDQEVVERELTVIGR